MIFTFFCPGPKSYESTHSSSTEIICSQKTTSLATKVLSQTPGAPVQEQTIRWNCEDPVKYHLELKQPRSVNTSSDPGMAGQQPTNYGEQAPKTGTQVLKYSRVKEGYLLGETDHLAQRAILVAVKAQIEDRSQCQDSRTSSHGTHFFPPSL